MSGKKRRHFIKQALLGSTAIGSGLLGFPSLAKTKDNAQPFDFSSPKSSFHLNPNKRYFNFAGLGCSPKSVTEAISKGILRLEELGESGHKLLDDVHEKLAHFFSVEAKDIAITHNTTEGINIVAKSVKFKRGDEIILTSHEHIGGSLPWLALAKEENLKIKVVDLNLNGEGNLEKISDAISRKTRLVSFSHVTCTTGMKLPAKQIAELCRKKNIYSCVDGAQAVGAMKIDISDIDPDFYVASGHKWMMGPKGTGVLYIKPDIIDQLKLGFVGAYSGSCFDLDNQDANFFPYASRAEYGTRNTAIAIGLGAAIDFVNAIGQDQIEQHSQQQQKVFRELVQVSEDIEIITPDNYGSILSLRSKSKTYKEIDRQLRSEYNCRVRSIYEHDLNAIRISFSLVTTMEDVHYLASSLNSILQE